MARNPKANLVQLYPGSSLLVHKNAFAWTTLWNDRETCRVNRFIERMFSLLCSDNDRDIWAEEGENCMLCVPSDVMKNIKGIVAFRFGESAEIQVYPTLRANLLRRQKYNSEAPEAENNCDDEHVENMWDYEFSPVKIQDDDARNS